MGALAGAERPRKVEPAKEYDGRHGTDGQIDRQIVLVDVYLRQTKARNVPEKLGQSQEIPIEDFAKAAGFRVEEQ